MRTLIVTVLALVAVAAAALWALAEFGSPGTQFAARDPLILQQPQTTPPPTPAPDVAAAPEAKGTAPLESLSAEPSPSPAQEIVEGMRALRSAPPPEPLIQPAQAMTAAATQVASAYRSRQVTYNRPPERLALDRPIDVSLVINATDNPDAGQDALQGFPGTIVERDVDLSETVSAQLTGVGFDITSQTVERQKLSGKTINRWQWRVTPTEIGTRTLILEIFGYESGSLDAEPLDAYRDEITVEVQQLDQIISWARGIQPLFAVIAGLAAALSALFAFLRFREERKRNRV